MKNTQSKLTQTLTQYSSTRYRLILTGTPLQVGYTVILVMLVLTLSVEQPARTLGLAQLRLAQDLQLRQIVRRVVQHTLRQLWLFGQDRAERRRSAAHYQAST